VGSYCTALDQYLLTPLHVDSFNYVMVSSNLVEFNTFGLRDNYSLCE
jgi:hypothetical protein